jgi:hypothetical protein
MRKLLLFLLLLYPILIFGQYIPDTIYSEVNGNYVKIFDNGAMRVCGTEYEHIVVRQDGNNLAWYQEWVSGMPVYCICNYDYMVEIGPLDTGIYNMDVYYESSQYVYLGSTTFEIQSPIDTDTLDVVSSYSSDCYFVGVNNEKNNTPINIKNQISTNSILFQLNSKDKYELEIINIQGKMIYQDEFDGNNDHCWDYSNIPCGIYIYRLNGLNHYYSGKLMVYY